ncbi:recombinase family protein [Streptomyces sp. NRRL S-118]|uniref:recombinase family protein n=1 Tax=Streptomyces sp. NRRL S-118 TaxID=1463881 RepID=UPI000A830E82|nr:recombinase family protein [Streptomyces sp. NRRL S-118]
MTDRIYLRHSTDKQTDARQKHAFKKLLTAGAPVYDDPATSSRVLSLDRAGFKRLLDEAAVGDTIRIADASRLFRSVADVMALRPVLIRRGLHLKVESGLLSGIDLAADDPGTKMVVSVLAAVLEFQRDMISENTKEGVAAADAAGKVLGRPSALDEDQAAAAVTAYREGAAVKALARQYGTSPKTIRRVLDEAGAREVPADLGVLLGDDVTTSRRHGVTDEAQEQVPEADPVVVVDVPGLVAEHLAAVADGTVRRALQDGRTIRRGQGYLVRATAPVSVHMAMVEHSAAALMQSPAGRKAHRIHSDRVTSARTAS